MVYTSLRILLLLAVGGALYLLGARGFLLIVLAFVLSGALSLVWLNRPRAEMSKGVERAIGRVNSKIDEAAASEDHLQEALQESEGQPDAESDAGDQERK